MKFLCVPCDSPMTLQTVGPPEGGSLTVVYACPACGYEMAMLTNAYETQVVQSLGVRIGPAAAAAEGAATKAGCPFSAMLAGTEGARDGAERTVTPEPDAVRWTTAAEARLLNIPAFVRPMARTGIERFARDKGTREVDEQVLDEARAFFGM
jgi:hypothetical protein